MEGKGPLNMSPETSPQPVNVPTLELDVDSSPRASLPPPATSLTLFDGDDSLGETFNTTSFVNSPAPGEGDLCKGNLTWDENEDENSIIADSPKYSEVVVVKGNYDAWITIHEVKDLKPFVPENIIDPVVFVECMGQRFNTRVVTGTTSYSYEKTFMAKKELTPETMESFEIKISVINANATESEHEAIGTYTVDASHIYCVGDTHHISRRWIGLVDDKRGAAEVRGWLKLSVAIVGPNDLIPHDFSGSKQVVEEEERNESLDKFTEPDIPRTVKKETKYLVTSVYLAEGLPFIEGSELDASVSVEFGSKKMSSKIVNVKSPTSEKLCSPCFNSEIWLPITYPTISSILKIQVWDSDELIATYKCDMERINALGEQIERVKEVMRAAEGKAARAVAEEDAKAARAVAEDSKKKLDAMIAKPYYANLYGAHVGPMNIALDEDAAEALAQEADTYNLFPDLDESRAPAYRGRILLKHRLENEIPHDLFQSDLQASASLPKLGGSSSAASIKKSPSVKKLPRAKREVSRTKKNQQAIDEHRYAGRAFRRHMSNVPTSHRPEEKKYELLCSVIRGTEMPTFLNKLTALDPDSKRSKIVIKLSCGSYTTCTEPAMNRNGVCEFYTLLSLECVLPEDVEACPDVIISACSVNPSTEELETFSYERYRFKEVFGSNKAEWLTLREDKAKDFLGFEMFPGSVLLRLTASSDIDLAAKMKAEWLQQLDDNDDPSPYRVRVHIYQGAELSGDVGRPNYVKVNFNGESAQKSKTTKPTNFPLFYETIEFDTQLPSPLYFPQVNIQLYSKDDIAFGLGEDDYIGCVNLKLGEEHIETGMVAPVPAWFSLGIEEEGDVGGKLLIAAQVIPLTGIDKSKIPEKPKLEPKMEDKLLEVIVVACSNLDFVPPLEYPSIGIEQMGSGWKEEHTKGSRRPSKADPNFMERKLLHVRVPVEDVYIDSFPLVARLYDNKSSGRRHLKGECLIRLDGTFSHNMAGGGSVAPFSPVKDLRMNQGAVENLEIVSPRLRIENEHGARFGGSLGTAPESVEEMDKIVGKGERFQLGRAMLFRPFENVPGVDKPFKSFPIGRGGRNIGMMKAKIGFIEVDKPSIDTRTLFRPSPKRYTIRCYVLQAWGLASIALDEATGRMKKPNPYLTIKCGPTTISDRSNGHNAVDSAEFYRCFELTTTLPSAKGGTILEVIVNNKHSHVDDDDVIGSTKIDLLDRYYSTTWQKVGMCNRVDDPTVTKGTNVYDEMERVVQRASSVALREDNNEEDAAGDAVLLPEAHELFARHGVGMTRCKHCNARYNKDLGRFQCYCKNIRYIRTVHQRLQTKPVEDRALKVPTSRLPRGAVRMWVDILPINEAKLFPVAFYLPDGYVQKLFKRETSSSSRHKHFTDQSIIDDVNGMDVINRMSIFYGDKKSNSIIIQCIAFKKYELLKFFLADHPLAAFTRHEHEEEDEDEEEEVEDSDESDLSEDEEAENMVLDHELIDGGGAINNEDAKNEEEEEKKDDGGLQSPQRQHSPRLKHGNSRRGHYKLTTSDAFDFALRKGKQDFQAVSIMLNVVCKPLIRNYGFIPDHFSYYVEEMIKADYADLVCDNIRQLPLFSIEEKLANDEPNKLWDPSWDTGSVKIRTAASDMGSLSFLNMLIDHVDTSVFDSDTMALVVDQMWHQFIRKRYMRDFGLLMVFVVLWGIQCLLYSDPDRTNAAGGRQYQTSADAWGTYILVCLLFALNTKFFMRECQQAVLQAEQRQDHENDNKPHKPEQNRPWGGGGAAVAPEAVAGVPAGAQGEGEVPEDGENAHRKKRRGKRHRFRRLLKLSPWKVAKSYFGDISDPDAYNIVDFINAMLIYVSIFLLKFGSSSPRTEVTIASLATFTFSLKVIKELRGFNGISWIVSVLQKNGVDMFYFAIVLGVWILSFAVSFHLSVSGLEVGDCGIDILTEGAEGDPAEYQCTAPPYGTLRRSIHSAFTMSILGDFDTTIFDDVEHSGISYFMFYLAMVLVQVVALNALIALLGDSYSDVESSKNANQRKQRASLIVEHLMLCSEAKKNSIEKESRILGKFIDKKDFLLGQASGGRFFETDADETTQKMEEMMMEIKDLREAVVRLSNQIDTA